MRRLQARNFALQQNSSSVERGSSAAAWTACSRLYNTWYRRQASFSSTTRQMPLVRSLPVQNKAAPWYSMLTARI